MPRKSTLKIILLAGMMLAMLQACTKNVPEPDLTAAKAKSEHCMISEDTAEVRKNHYAYILHQRDETMYDGIRTEQYSLKACVNCHVPEVGSDGKKVHYSKAHDHAGEYSSDTHFCATCHEYTAVKIDCFQCHRDTPEVSTAVAQSGQAYQHNDATVQAQVNAQQATGGAAQ
ncbi:MAG: hypothetical protein ACWA5U_05250 [bacterium]